MRLPVRPDASGPTGPEIDEPEAIRMIRYAIDEGVNYVDTAYLYHGSMSEVVTGKALRDGYRDKVKIATKMPSWIVKDYNDFDRILNEQHERLETNRIDFYLAHSLNKDQWPQMRDLGFLAWAEEKMARGQIGCLGFSFHDNLDTFKEIVDATPLWTFCQIQYNYMDTEFQAGDEGLRYAADRGLAVVVMEPLRGGALGKEPPEAVKTLFKKAGVHRTPADIALQWIWGRPEVTLLLSGMSTMDQVVENIASAERSGIGKLDDRELKLVNRIRDAYRMLAPIPCTACGYCMPCPAGVDIPHAFAKYNDARMYDDPRTARFRYRQIPKNRWADKCTECGDCEEQCPQNIDVATWLKTAHAFLGPVKS